jgi:phage terminase large subunit-like protein
VQAEVGNVFMVGAPWNSMFLGEVGDAPYGSHDDQLDAVSGAFQVVAIGGSSLAASDLLSIGGKPEDWEAATQRKIF